jgi:hypothetical protein
MHSASLRLDRDAAVEDADAAGANDGDARH